jgi:hypothetical protein
MHKSEIEENFKKQKKYLVVFFIEFKKGGFETKSTVGERTDCV